MRPRRTHGLPRTASCYGDVLRLRRVPITSAAPTHALFGGGGVRLLPSTGKAPEFDRPWSVLDAGVQDAAEPDAGLAATGVAMLGEPPMVARTPAHELWIAVFRDPTATR